MASAGGTDIPQHPELLRLICAWKELPDRRRLYCSQHEYETPLLHRNPGLEGARDIVHPLQQSLVRRLDQGMCRGFQSCLVPCSVLADRLTSCQLRVYSSCHSSMRTRMAEESLTLGQKPPRPHHCLMPCRIKRRA